MRILALRGENLASLQTKFEIDFAGGRLADAGLFAITGKTGAGKSTLLDAICLALYDRIPRLQSNKKNDAEIGRDSDENRIKANDVRSILSRGKADGFAEVDFIANDGSQWRSHWQVRRARGRAEGKMQAAEQWLENLETGQRFAGKKQELQAEIERLIGLSFDQFRRAVMLPQGEFAAFLKAGADERATLLERMTGGEIYGRLSIAAHERAKDEKLKLTQLQAKLGDIALLTDEEQQLLTNQLATTREQVNRQQQQLEQLKYHQDVIVNAAKLTQRSAESEQQLSQAKQAQQLAEPRYVQLQKYEQALPARGDFTLLAQAKQQVNKWQQTLQATITALTAKQHQQVVLQDNVQQGQQQLTQKQQALTELEPKLKQAASIEQQRAGLQQQNVELQQQLAELNNQLTAQRQQLASQQQQQQLAQSQQQQVQAALAQTQAVKALAEQQNAIKDNLNQFQHAQSQIEQLQTEIKQRQTALATITQQQTKLDQQLSALDQRQQQLTQQTAAHDLTVLEQCQDQQRQHYGAYQQLSGLLKESLFGLDKWHGVLQQRDKFQLQLQGLVSHIASCEQRLTALMPQLLQLNAQHKEVELQLNQSRAVMNLTDYRAQLIEGESCPLCGSKEHPYQQHNPQVETIISQQQQRLQQLAQQLQDAHAEQRQLTQSVAQDKQRQTELEQDIVGFNNSIETLVKQQQCQWTDLMATDLNSISLAEIVLATDSDVAQLAHYQASWSQALENAAAQMQHIKTEGEQRKLLIENVKQQQHQLQQLSQQQAELKDQSHLLTQQQTQAQEQLNAFSAQVSSLQYVVDERQQALMTIYGNDSWLTGLAQQGKAGFIADLERQIEHYQTNIEQQQQLEKQLIELAPVLATLTNSVQHGDQQATEIGAKVTRLVEEQQGCWQQRMALIGEAPLATIEHAAKADVEAQQQQCQQRQTQLHQLAEVIAADVAKQHHATQQLAEFETAQQQLQQQWQAWLQKLALTDAELTELLSHDETWLQHLRSELKQLEQAVAQGETIVKERHQAQVDFEPSVELAQLWFSDHEMSDDVVMQQQMLTQWQAEKLQLDDQVFQLRQRLEQGEQAQQQAGDLRNALAAQQTQTELWLQMNELIGSATGNKFRTLAQGLTLQQLVLAANEHLQDLAPRYALQPVPGSPLALQVIDHDMGDEVRSVESLSGGESFLVSLSLALALASLAADTRQLGSLFIDEGFGTLDPESLEMALACLDALQADGRQIGVISHVGTLVERIGVQVAVEAMGGGRSQIVIKG
ncbi:exonuclease SbcC [Photobacterium aquimaris]|uniref:Exonuclease SbcC n=1 Tax=Photobacterium aquimaris TaxID=512643 RepID=A0A2T3IJG2_9GAMM|nr:AAA family ATPase [Photobacterium aquimaris]OBU16503.1 exonuclease SbcC [Photobacterium aquimaris]OBU17369.1 exonuclease SbcC [Photobacterium aquimaris]PSU28484.1 exonuclease SbcC [Photobacterium aquimaris]PSW02706.1 exonuclease SbcC [Photobacterium aquimaris]